MKESILRREVDKAVEAVKVHSLREESVIGERDLRKILNQCLPGVPIQLKNVFVDQLRNFNKPNEINMFRTFLVNEVLA